MRLPGVMLIAAVAALPACEEGSGPSSCTPTATQICMTASSFVPSALTVAGGTTVTWSNGSSLAHTVTSDVSATESFDSDVGVGGTFSRQFNTPGTYSYHCELHGGMTGTLTVN